MKYAFFQGCNIPVRIPQYAEATQALLGLFQIELQVTPEFNCCGYPMRNVDEKSYLLPSVRNLALAEKAGLDIVVICNCCFQSLKKTERMMATNKELAEELNRMLEKEGLAYSGKTTINHYLSVLYNEVGLNTIKDKLVYRYTELNCAVIHGCHLLRPREITGFDNSFVPAITNELLAIAGATSVDWPGSLECCGAALAGFNDELSLKLLAEKITGARERDAAFITPICSYCHLQFDTAQPDNLETLGQSTSLPVLLLPQLLGLCLGLGADQLGIRQNRTITAEHLNQLASLLGPPVEEKKKKRAKKAAA